jgi:ribosomal protein L11 methyltransferase
VAAANARRNRVGERIRFSRMDLASLPRRPAARFDMVCANLVAPLLTRQRRRILQQVRPGGVLVVAGILAAEFGGVEAAFLSAGAVAIRRRTERGWRSAAYRIPA